MAVPLSAVTGCCRALLTCRPTGRLLRRWDTDDGHAIVSEGR
jgi:hypothetical protein